MASPSSVSRTSAPRAESSDAVSYTHLDVYKRQVLNLLDDLVDRFGLTMIFVSHDLRVVRHVCSRAIVMRQGRIVESAPTASLFSDPQTDYTRALLAAIPAFRGA